MLKGPIAQATIRTSFVLGLRLVVQAGTLLLVARMLGPEQFGAFAGVAALAVLLGTLASLGSNLVFLSAMSKDPNQRDNILSWAIPTTLVCGAVLLVFFIAISKAVLSAADVSLVVLLAIGITEIWLQPLFGLVSSEYHAQGRIALSQLLRVTPLVLRMLFAIGVLLSAPESPLTIYAFGYCIASLLSLKIVLYTLQASWPKMKLWRFPKSKELKSAAGFAAINITNLAPSELDKTLAIRLLPIADAGLYSAAARVIGAVVLPVIAMLLSALPRLFREGAAINHQRAKLTYWIFAVTALYSLLIAGLLWLIAPMFDWVFGDEYKGISDMVRLLCFAVPGLALRLAAGNVLLAIGKVWGRVGYEFIGVLILLTSSIILTSQFGSLGMPLAWAGSELVMAIFGWIYVKLLNN